MVTNKLKMLREEKGYSMRRLCRETHIDYQSISKYENGERPISAKSLEKLTKFFDVSADFLLGHSNIRNNNTTPDSFDIAFFGEIKNLTPESKAKILDYVKLVKLSEKK